MLHNIISCFEVAKFDIRNSLILLRDEFHAFYSSALSIKTAVSLDTPSHFRLTISCSVPGASSLFICFHCYIFVLAVALKSGYAVAPLSTALQAGRSRVRFSVGKWGFS